jgi:type I restriction enzyme S subunit
MNPAQLLAYFDRISEAPDAIPRLRRFILDLAVRGKLVEQNPSEGTGRGTLSDIKKLKAQMLLEKGIRGRQTVESSIRPKNFGLPSTWATVSVDDIGIVQGGKRLPAGATFSKVQTAHIYIRVTDMKNGTIVDDQLQYITHRMYSVQSLATRSTGRTFTSRLQVLSAKWAASQASSMATI